MAATVAISFFFHVIVLFAILSTGIFNKSIFTGRSLMPGSAIHVKLVDVPGVLIPASAPSEKAAKDAEIRGNKKISELPGKKDAETKKMKKDEEVIKSHKSRVAIPDPMIKEKPQPSDPVQTKAQAKGETSDAQNQEGLHDGNRDGNNVKNGEWTREAGFAAGDGISGGPAVDGTNFKYDYYLDIIRNRVNSRWNQPIEYHQVREALIEFTIKRNGRIDNVRISESSGDNYFDQTVLRAVSQSNPFPPLPRGYKDDFLRVRYRFIFGRKG